jgi:hypothetical protein
LIGHSMTDCFDIIYMNILKNMSWLFFFQSDSESRKVSENNDILGSLEKIVEISKKYGIDKCLSRGKAHLDYVTGKLEISPLQAVLFSHFMEQSASRQIMLSEIAYSL